MSDPEDLENTADPDGATGEVPDDLDQTIGRADQAQHRHDDAGLDLARSIARGLAGRTPAHKNKGQKALRTRRGAAGAGSGSHPDERDPQSLDTTMGRLLSEQGWETDVRVHGVFTRWEAIVGREVGQHVQPESYADGKLVVRTDSTAWATQMKLLAATVVRRLNEELGDESVRVIDVLGPNAPSWKRGSLRVKGRGPRDTYG